MPCIRVYATGHNTFPRLYLIAAKSGRVKITLFVRPRFIDLAFRHSSVNLVRVSPKRHNGCICPSAQYPLLAVARSMLPNRTFWFLRKNYRVRTLRTDKTVSRQLVVTNWLWVRRSVFLHTHTLLSRFFQIFAHKRVGTCGIYEGKFYSEKKIPQCLFLLSSSKKKEKKAILDARNPKVLNKIPYLTYPTHRVAAIIHGRQVDAGQTLRIWIRNLRLSTNGICIHIACSGKRLAASQNRVSFTYHSWLDKIVVWRIIIRRCCFCELQAGQRTYIYIYLKRIARPWK